MAAETSHEELQKRAAKNQSLFREVNERVNENNKGHAVWASLTDWVCECADETCTEPIELTPEQYEEVREHSTHFAVAPSGEHVVVEVERVAEKHERFWVVSKIEEAAVVAMHFDPRSRGGEPA